MKPGYIYMLQNSNYGPYAIKIGKTKNPPSSRALDLYRGASGVPTPFNLIAAYSVGNIDLAEKSIHKRLKAFRLNNRREFFRVSPTVAASLLLETCTIVNKDLGLSPPEAYTLDNSTTTATTPTYASYPAPETDEENFNSNRLYINPSNLKFRKIGTSTLTPDQIDRATIIAALLSEVFPDDKQRWLQDFSRDRSPEREITIWEKITKAYLTVEEIHFASDELKKEAFTLLLLRSMQSTNETLKQTKLRLLNKKSARRLLDAYELKPKPITVDCL